MKEKNHRGQVVIEMLFSMVVLSMALSGFVLVGRLVAARLEMIQNLRWGTQSTLLTPFTDQDIEQGMRTRATFSHPHVTVRRFLDTPSSRFYHLKEISVTAEKLPFSLTMKDRMVIQPPQEDP